MSDKAQLSNALNMATARAKRIRVKAVSADDLQTYIRNSIAPDLDGIIAKAKTQAMEGDKDARTFLFERGYGKVAQNMAISSTVEHRYSGQVNVAVLAAQTALQLKEQKTQ